MTDQPIKTRKDGGILEVTIDRPKANAIDLVTSRIMGDIFTDFSISTCNGFVNTTIFVDDLKNREKIDRVAQKYHNSI